MNRRHFLSLCALAGATPLLHERAFTAADSWQAEFAAALRANPYLEGFRGTSQETLAASNLPIEGRIPAGLRGVFYRNGPAQHEVGDLRYHHWFDGDGMVQSFRVTDSGVSHLGRFVRTDKRVAELAARKALRRAFGTDVAGAQPVSSPDTFNPANTNIVAHAGELLALWEGGSAYRLDGDSLETLGVKVWRKDLKGVAFSAHPKVDPEGTLWNFGLSPFDSMLVLYKVAGSGELANAGVVRAPDMTMVHDFAVTSKYLVFLLPPMRVNKEKFSQGKSFLGSNEWLAGRPMRILVVDKNDLNSARTLELPAGFMFHFGNAWDDGGTIRFDYLRYNDATAMTKVFSEFMRGVVVIQREAEVTLVTVDLAKGVARQESMPGEAEFPRVDPRVVGTRHRHLFVGARSVAIPQRWGFNAVRRLDLDTGKTDEFDYGRDFLVEEHIVVPDRSSSQEGKGWVIGTALDVKQRKTVWSVFDAMNLSAGPLARATLPYALPLGFHGNFRAA